MKKTIAASWHLAYWFMYSLIVLLIWSASRQGVGPPLQLGGLEAIKAILYICFIAPFSFISIWPGLLGFYSFYFLLFGRFLARRKTGMMILSAIGISLAVPLLLVAIMHVLSPDAHFPVVPMFLCISGVTFANGVLGLVLRAFISWFDDIKIKADLNQRNYEMELALIKAQINPHFLFNTINNIDTLIQKDAPRASEYLNKLSDIMRFMLYEANSGRIALSKELFYIEKYIDLQRIRTSNPKYIHYEVQGDPGNLLIEPMLFIPFIENAFKHSGNKKVENAIGVSFHIDGNKVCFECENVYSPGSPEKPEPGGLGNELIRRRLALLYPNNHTFEVINMHGIYKVILTVAV